MRGNQDPAPRLHYCLLTAPPLSLHPLPSLISNHLKLPFGTQGRSWRPNEAYFLQTRNGGHRKTFVPRSPTWSCSVSPGSHTEVVKESSEYRGLRVQTGGQRRQGLEWAGAPRKASWRRDGLESLGREKGQEEHCEWGEELLGRAGGQEEQGPLGFQGHDSGCHVRGQGVGPGSFPFPLHLPRSPGQCDRQGGRLDRWKRKGRLVALRQEEGRGHPLKE